MNRCRANAVLTLIVIAAVVCPMSLVFGQNRQPARLGPRPQSRDMTRLIERFDKNSDGELDESELPEKFYNRLKASDKNKDGKLSKDELKNVNTPGSAPDSSSPSRRPGEVITGAAKGERYDDTLKVGDVAPDFTLSNPTGTREVTLSSFKDQRPVVMIFGSYT